MSTANTSRLQTIDVVKGIGIILVVFAHVNYTPLLLTLIYGFHMPLFFLVSGFLFDRSRYADFRSFFLRRLKTLICPYIFFYLLAVVITFGLQVIENGFSTELLLKRLEGLVQMVLAQGGSDTVVLAPFWFVLALFATELIYYFLSAIRSKVVLGLICAVLSALGWLLQSGMLPFPNELLPWNLDSALFVIGFYGFGNLLRAPISKGLRSLQEHKYRWLICLGIAALCFLLYLPLVWLNGKTSIGSKNLHHGLLLYATGILGTAAVTAVSILLRKSRILQFCGRNSFCIMSVHCLLTNLLSTGCKLLHIPEYDSYSLAQSLIPLVVILGCSLGLAWLYSSTVKKISK